MDEFIESVGIVVVGTVAVLVSVFVLLIIQPWFWLAIIAITLIKQ